MLVANNRVAMVLSREQFLSYNVQRQQLKTSPPPPPPPPPPAPPPPPPSSAPPPSTNLSSKNKCVKKKKKEGEGNQIKLVNINNLHCDDKNCNQILESKDSKILHMKDHKQHHWRQNYVFPINFKNLSCEICYMNFKSEQNKLYHYEINHKKILDSYCIQCNDVNFVNMQTKSKKERHKKQRHQGITSDNEKNFYENLKKMKLTQIGRGQKYVYSQNKIGLYLDSQNKCVICKKNLEGVREDVQRHHFLLCIGKKKVSDDDDDDDDDDDGDSKNHNDVIRVETTTQKGLHKLIRYQWPQVDVNVEQVFYRIRPYVDSDIVSNVMESKEVNIHYVIVILFERTVNGVNDQQFTWFRMPGKDFNCFNIEQSDLDAYMMCVNTTLSEKVEDYLNMGSGWKIVDVISHEITLITRKKIGKKVGKYIKPNTPLQKLMRGKYNCSQIINPKTDDHFCLIYCIAIHQAVNGDRMSLLELAKTNPEPNKDYLYAHYGSKIDKLKSDLSSFVFPLKINRGTINKIKKILGLQKRINFIGYENGELFNLSQDCDVFPTTVTPSECYENLCNCPLCHETANLMYEEMCDQSLDLLVYSNQQNSHVSLIADFDTLFTNITKNRRKKYICRMCFFNSLTALNLFRHRNVCSKLNRHKSKMILPKNEKNLNGDPVIPPQFRFKNHFQKLRKQHFSVLDIETSFEKEEPTKNNNGVQQKLKAESCLVKTINLYEECNQNDPPDVKMAKKRVFESNIEYGVECIQNSLITLKKHCKIIKDDMSCITKHHLKPKLNDREKHSFLTARFCALCNKPFDTKDKRLVKVRNHCHSSGVYLNACHLICNFRFKDSSVHPLYMHSGRSFDMHFIVKNIINKIETGGKPLFKKIKPIIQSSEKFLCIDLQFFCDICHKHTDSRGDSCNNGVNEGDDNDNDDDDDDDNIDNDDDDSGNGDGDGVGDGNVDGDGVDLNKKKRDRRSCDHYKIVRCLDSLSFLPGSLSSLVDNMRKDGNSDYECEKMFEQTMKVNNNQYEGLMSLDQLLRKGVFPYHWFESGKMDYPSLPSKEDFFDHLRGCVMAQSEYNYAQNIWHSIEMAQMSKVEKNPEKFIPNFHNLPELEKLVEMEKVSAISFKDFHDYYLSLDCSLLADLIINHRKICYNEHKLELLQFITLPSYSWAALTQNLDERLDFLTCEDMYLWLESFTYGGLCFLSTRYAKANNKYLQTFDTKLPTKYLMQLDCVNLYGASMALFNLPSSNFIFLSDHEMVVFENEVRTGSYEKWTDEAAEIEKDEMGNERCIGYFIEAWVRIPLNLHSKFNDFPPFCERMSVPDEWLSDIQMTQKENIGIKGKSQQPKLIPHLFDQKNIKLHYLTLKFLLEEGVELIKCVKVLRFTQTKVMAPYIKENTQKRKIAKSTQEKEYRKLLNNTVYGRTLLNKRHYSNAHFVLNSKSYNREVCKSSFKRYIPYSEHTGVVFHHQPSFHADQHVYLGAAILAISKVIMYRFYYRVLTPFCQKKGIKVNMNYIDTDGMVLTFEYPQDHPHGDLFKDLFELIEHLDLHEYSLDHPFYTQLDKKQYEIALKYRDENKKKIGTFSDELSNKYINEFAGLRAKCYSVKTDEGDEKKKCGGTSITSNMSDFNFSLYKKMVFQEKFTHYAQQNRFYADKHDMLYKSILKKSMDSFDNKRYLLHDGIHTLAHGHVNGPKLK